jgi:phosphoglycolate phosphatase
MIEACLSETGAAKADTVMIGDTTYDMDMARAAGVTGLGVTWGYHDAANLRAVGATDVLDDYAQLLPWLTQHWGMS